MHEPPVLVAIEGRVATITLNRPDKRNALSVEVIEALAAAFDGRDGVTALGAMGGFLAALILARFAIALAPRLMPAPRLVPIRTPSSPISIQEFHHD